MVAPATVPTPVASLTVQSLRPPEPDRSPFPMFMLPEPNARVQRPARRSCAWRGRRGGAGAPVRCNGSFGRVAGTLNPGFATVARVGTRAGRGVARLARGAHTPACAARQDG